MRSLGLWSEVSGSSVTSIPHFFEFRYLVNLTRYLPFGVEHQFDFFRSHLINDEPLKIRSTIGYKPKDIMNIYVIIHRWHNGLSISAIANTLNQDRKTVRRDA
jgi:hypothetical protein